MLLVVKLRGAVCETFASVEIHQVRFSLSPCWGGGILRLASGHVFKNDLIAESPAQMSTPGENKAALTGKLNGPGVPSRCRISKRSGIFHSLKVSTLERCTEVHDGKLDRL